MKEELVDALIGERKRLEDDMKDLKDILNGVKGNFFYDHYKFCL